MHLKNRNSALLLLFFLVSFSAHAQKIHVNYDKTLDFSKFKTYAWEPIGKVAHPMLAADIVGAIEDELKARGLTLTANNPDLVVQVYGSIDQESTFYSNDPLYNATGGIPPFDPSMTGPWSATYYGNTTVTIHPGELVIDLIQASAKKLVWRAMAQQNLSSNPQKMENEVNNAISKMFKDYPVKR